MDHSFYMQKALDLAKAGWPRVAPNPMVGCVIVSNNKIVSQGYHERYGEGHAEVNAINKLPAEVDPRQCTLYVTLEPCTHFGKTPPCADLIIKKQFNTVVVASPDPNPLVAGKGISKLKEAGITVVSGVLEKESRELNKRFNCFHENKRPYIILKWAITADGFISRKPVPADQQHNRITGAEAQKLVHQIRSEVAGIMVGKNTVLNDDPLLTTRLVQGKNPMRIVVDPDLEVKANHQVLNSDADTIIFNKKVMQHKENLHYMKLDFTKNILPELFASLHKMHIQSVLVEGGAHLLESLLKEDLWDEALVFQNPALNFGDGLKGPVFPIKNSFDLVGDDKLFHHFKNEALPAKGALSEEIF